MGDRRGRTFSKATETTPTTSTNAATQVQTVADLHPSEPTKVEDAKPAQIEPEVKAPVEEELVAHFVSDSVPDGSVLPPNCVFEQTWILRNTGSKPWPAGCTVKFVGGDNMCAVDPEHPASVHELVSAAESTTCYSEVAPGQEFGFTVLMRTPSRPGKVISYWRLTGPTGNKFGHRLWCDVTVDEPAPVVKEEPKEEVKEEPKEDVKEDVKEEPKEDAKEDVKEPKVDDEEVHTSKMIFPKLEKESPATSIHQEVAPAKKQHEAEEFEDFVEEDADIDDDNTEDGFLTDEEYDILDASDEEYLAEQEKAVKK
jgi:next to BRCA1 gene 1 protein